MCLSLNEITHGLSLCEVEASVSNSPQSEFTRVGRPGAEEEKGIEDTQEERRRAMTTELYDIFAGVGMGRFEEGN